MAFAWRTTAFIAARRALVVPSIALLLAATAIVAARHAASQASLVGTYDGHQMEMAAGLELKADGRFRYALAYGALDEEAAGTWTRRGDQVLLNSDPVTPPRFVLVSQGRGANGSLQVQLDVPRGTSRQYFDAIITKTNGQTEKKQFAEDGLVLPFGAEGGPTGLRLTLQMFGIVSEPVRLDPRSGYSLHFRFEPNDLGKVDFRATPLAIINGNLVLDRHGRTITFKRTKR